MAKPAEWKNFLAKECERQRKLRSGTKAVEENDEEDTVTEQPTEDSPVALHTTQTQETSESAGVVARAKAALGAKYSAIFGSKLLG